ncbi:MAG TPA: hypothetical protein VGI80_03095, partial [Pyrinomonadaceae bacterium]
ARNLAEYINRVAYRGERFVLLRGNKRVAELGPAHAAPERLSLAERLAAVPHLDLEDVEQFASDIEEARRELNSVPVRDPWEDS